MSLNTARSSTTDPYQNHRFSVSDTKNLIVGGFNTVTIPEMNIDMGEYREGLWTYSRKYPIRPHFTQMTLHKGVFIGDTNFFQIVKAATNGLAYRTDIIITPIHRTEVAGQTNYQLQGTARRQLKCKNCLPVRYRPASDFDAMNSDVAIEEIDFEVEFFQLLIDGNEV